MAKPMTSHAITPTAEDYLRTIFVLGEDMQPVIAARVAEEVGVSPSTIVTTLRRLQSQGYLKVERRKEIHLTAKGRRGAEGVLPRHFLTEGLFTHVLGMDWGKAPQEAPRLGHAISAHVEERLAKVSKY